MMYKNIPVTISNFVFPELDEIEKNLIERDEYFDFGTEVPKLIEKGMVSARLEEVGFKLIKASACIRDGGRGDEDGYGVEPDTWIVAFLNSDLKLISPFALEDSRINRNITNFMKAGIDPFNEDGHVKTCPFDKVEMDDCMPGYFRILKGNDWGFADAKLNILIPPAYKIIKGDPNGLVRFTQHNGLYGLLNTNNEIIISAIYNWLFYIDQGEFVGYYEANLNGKTGILSRNNEVVREFK